MSKKINALANQIVSQLKANGFHVLRYNAYSSNSVYLKMDYGVCHSIRISDHSGKKHLGYRYNVLSTNETKTNGQSANGHPRYFYPFNAINDLIQDIISARQEILDKYGLAIYKLFMKRDRERGEQATKGFWADAKEA